MARPAQGNPPAVPAQSQSAAATTTALLRGESSTGEAVPVGVHQLHPRAILKAEYLAEITNNMEKTCCNILKCPVLSNTGLC